MNSADVLGPDGLFARSVPGWEHRPQQLVMARAVAEALEGLEPLLVEAGTGTGKTLGYMVPAILSGKRVVVSTATRALQEQLAGKDIPLLEKQLPGLFSAAVLKGVANYLCLRRYSETADVDDPALATISDWAARTLTGDRAELATIPDDAEIWRRVTTTPDTRLGPRCPFFERCWVTQARRRAAKAEIVIVNHHLYFADLALRAHYPGAAILPPHDAVIFDEAHALEEVATEHFGIAVSTARLAALGREAENLLPDATALRANLDTRAEALFAALRQRIGAGGGDGARVAAPADLFAAERREAWFRLDAALEELSYAAARRGDEDAEVLSRRAEGLRTDLATVADAAPGRYVHWAEVRGRAVHLHASPVDVAPLLRQHVIETIGAVVFTSATLSADGRFDYARARLGLAELPATELCVESPFDYAQQALLYLPRDLPLPDDPGFAQAVVERTVQLLEITRGRALVLFTSWRSLRTAATALRGRVPYPILVQGEAPRGALLDAFRADIGSVLLATSSFWEGVDVPGESLSLVVVDKLPFQSPDDPLAAARAARVEEAGQDPFVTQQLPRAALALKQGFGRLIRRRDDRGIVAVLDQRILTRAYGRAFIATLPPAPRTSVLEQVRRFWARGTC